MTLIGSGPVIGAAAIAPYIQDSSALKHSNAQIPALPSGFPTTLKSDLAWTRADFACESSYIYELTRADIDEINEALSHFKRKYSIFCAGFSPCSYPNNGFADIHAPLQFWN